ncbi:MAG TPA: hypothetical protein PLM57_14925, partial [Candidatus Latescibacteria bacterium]|nr:hypothetical protein [Candidatus Latescibacterota bacterium]
TTRAAAVLAAAVIMGAKRSPALSDPVFVNTSPSQNRRWEAVFTNTVPLRWEWNTHAATSNYLWQAFLSVTSPDKDMMIPIRVDGVSEKPCYGVIKNGKWKRAFPKSTAAVSVCNLADGSVSVPPVAAGSGRVANDISLPSQLWMLSDTQNDIFVKPILKRWRPYDDFVRFDMDRKYPKFMRRLSHVASLDKPVDGAVMDVSLVNGDAFETVRRLRTTLRVGQKGIGEKDVCVQVLGDSYTHGEFFRDALLDSGYVPKLHLEGLLRCRPKGETDHYNEGRGGATLGTYFQVPMGELRFYHGFMHPREGRYWGSRAFWVMAWRCFRGTQPEGFEPTYVCSRYDRCLPRFDEKTGTLLHPEPGDIQYDDNAKTMARWSGKEWTTVDMNGLTWGFDYAKYLAMWKLKKPDFLFVLLGLNDFINSPKADFAQWGERITIMKDSYLKACPGGRFVICIPCSTCGSIDNLDGVFTPSQNAAMWRFRDWLIRNFDNRVNEGFYLLDVSACIDEDNGYWLEKGPVTVPHAKYDGEERLKVQKGSPHPYANYRSMGIPLAAFIQYFRDRQ